MTPDFTEQQWHIAATDNKIKVVLTQRHDINFFYTSLEKLNDETNRWEHMKGSSVAHTNSRAEAEARVKNLLKTVTTFS